MLIDHGAQAMLDKVRIRPRFSCVEHGTRGAARYECHSRAPRTSETRSSGPSTESRSMRRSTRPRAASSPAYRRPSGVASALGLEVSTLREDGGEVEAKVTRSCVYVAPRSKITFAEETLIGLLSKPSGIATATRRLVEEAAGQIRIVGGAWKKAPPSTKSLVRRAVAIGGANGRMAEHPMIYLDKNYVRMLGGLRQALEGLEPPRRASEGRAADRRRGLAVRRDEARRRVWARPQYSSIPACRPTSNPWSRRSSRWESAIA